MERGWGEEGERKGRGKGSKEKGKRKGKGRGREGKGEPPLFVQVYAPVNICLEISRNGHVVNKLKRCQQIANLDDFSLFFDL